MDLYDLISKVLTEDVIKGGLADGKSIDDIAKTHNKSSDEMSKMLTMGIAVEREHTTDNKVAREIALDHLMEDPNYYVKLKKIEKK